jgi:hypothetical protein
MLENRAIVTINLEPSQHVSANCRASVSAPNAFGVHRMESAGAERHRRAAREGERAGASESNACNSPFVVNTRLREQIVSAASSNSPPDEIADPRGFRQNDATIDVRSVAFGSGDMRLIDQ